MLEDFFPQGLALGNNFCNRVDEQARLTHDISLAKPVLVISPRRYGKTSLILTVLHKMGLPFACMDLYSHLNEVEVQNAILSAVGDILYSLESAPKKALQRVTDFFSELSINFKFADAQIRVDFAQNKQTPAKTVLGVLQKLDGILKKKNKKVVLFFDEFQRLCQITDNAALEGAIRHVAQESKHISFVFSGTNRHLLAQMFDDRAKPLYKLCDRIALDRMHKEHYLPFIQSKARLQWKKRLDEDVIDAILEWTQRHPYYVNLLCHRLWFTDAMPNLKTVEASWRSYCLEEKSNVMNELELLSGNQGKMLMAIAKYGEANPPMSGEFLNFAQFPPSSASQAVQALHKKDYLYLDGQGAYRILDPLIRHLFSMN
jgi:AAA+ ATPase superfamily predicted ATPase